MNKSLVLRLIGAAGLVSLGVVAEMAAVTFQSGFAWFASFPLIGAGLGTPFRSPWWGAGLGVLLFCATAAWAIGGIFSDGLPVD